MATYHLSAKIFSRSRGHSAVEKAAYRSGEKLYDQRLGETFDFTKKRGVIHAEILAPENAPAWMRDRSELWNRVEAYEVRRDAVLAREIEISIPRELGSEARLEVVRGFVREQFVARGMVADVCVHEVDSDKPHAHIMLTMRAIDGDGFGNKERSWNAYGLFYEWRVAWAEHANRALHLAGIEERIDHRSYESRNIALEPQPKLFRSSEDSSKDGRDLVQRRVAELARVARENGERIIADPKQLLELLTSRQAAFSRTQMLRTLNTYTADAEQFSRCLAAVMASPELVPIPSDTGPERFTTRTVLAAERSVRVSGDALRRDASHRVDKRFVAQAIKTRPTIGEDQTRALHHLTRRTGGLALLEGYAGTGKSFMLDAAREAWEAQGLTVVGGALAGKAAEGLEESARIPSRTLASWLRSIEHGTDGLTAKHVVVIDEAGMVGTRQMEELMAHAQHVGAKVVLVGDSRQLQAIEAGSPFHMLATEHGAEKLTNVMRQREAWMGEATRAFGDGDTAKALAAYHDHGRFHESEKRREALQQTARAWMEHRLAKPAESSLMLAYRRADAVDLNQFARKACVARGELGALGTGLVVQTEYGEREFAKGDRIYFGLNDRREVGVTNGTLGVVELVRGTELVVKLDSERLVVVDTEKYKHLDHGYAVTVHKSQGVTVDRVFAAASERWTSEVAYVAMSRHRTQVDVFWSREEFAGREALDRALCRVSPKDMAHALLEEAQAERVAPLPPGRPAAIGEPATPAMPPPAAAELDDAQRTARIVALGEQLRQMPIVEEADVLRGLDVYQSAFAIQEKAREDSVRALKALEHHRSLSWFEKLRGPSERELSEAFDRANERTREAGDKCEALLKDPALLARARQLADKRNAPRDALLRKLNALQEPLRVRQAEVERQRELERDKGRGRGGWGR